MRFSHPATLQDTDSIGEEFFSFSQIPDKSAYLVRIAVVNTSQYLLNEPQYSAAMNRITAVAKVTHWQIVRITPLQIRHIAEGHTMVRRSVARPDLLFILCVYSENAM